MLLDPERVTMLTTPPVALPNSAGYELVRTWNSRTDSWLKLLLGPPRIRSLLSKPSTIRLLATGRCPSTDSPDVSAAGSTGPPVVTPAARAASSMKRRPLSGSCSMSCVPMMVDTAVWEGLTTGSAGLDAHALLDGGDLEREGHLDELADLDRQALAHRRREPLVLGAQVVLARLERDDAELALAIGGHVTDDVGGTVARADGGGGEPAAGGVLDVSTDIRAGRARLRGGCRHGDDKDTDAEQSSGSQVHGRVLGRVPSVTQETLAFPRRLWLELKVRATPADSKEGAFDQGTSATPTPGVPQ